MKHCIATLSTISRELYNYTNGHTLVSVGHPASKNKILRQTILRQTAHIGVPFVSKFKDSANYQQFS